VKWIMFVILALIVILLVTAVVALAGVVIWLVVRREGPLVDRLRAAKFPAKRLLALPLAAWLALFFIILLMLLFVSAMCLMYTFALLHGEWLTTLQSLPKTAGNILIHLIYPLQVFLFALVTFFMAVGGLQLVIGPVEKLARLRLRVVDVADFARRTAVLIALAAGLEVVKILLYGLLVAPEHLSSFFARETLPKADPLGVALLATAILLLSAVFWLRRKGDR